MSLDETKENDEIFTVGDFQYIIEKELLEKAAPITVDFTESGFKIDAALEMDASAGCGGCGSAGSC